MTHRIRIALAVLLTTLGLTFTATASSADPKDECATDLDSLGCLRQTAETQCAAYGSESTECLTASNVYLEARVSWGDSWVADLTGWTTRLAERVAFLERRVDRLKDKVQRLKAQIDASDE